MRGVYAIVDLGALSTARIEPLPFARALIETQPAALQVRAKTSPVREVLALLEQLAPICKQARVPLVNNDRIDVALAGHCDMVHLGQDDLPIEAARRIDAEIGIGLSTHTPDQLARALESRPTYVAYGPIFATGSKKNHEPVVGLDGLETARDIVSKSVAPRTPLVAIGGITVNNAADVIAHCDAIAVIGALVGHDVAARMRVLQNAIGEKR